MTDTEPPDSDPSPPGGHQPTEAAPRVQAFLLRHSARPDGQDAADAEDGVEDVFFLQRPTGRIAYSLYGKGPPIICIPGVGDVRSVYRFLGPSLAKAGFQVAPMDIRGHGESDATFDRYDVTAAGTDVIALAERLGGPVILIGNSIGAAAACWAAAEAPALVAGLVLLGPVVRDGRANLLGSVLLRVALLWPWGPAIWSAYFRKLYPTRRQTEYEAHFAEVTDSLLKPGYWQAFCEAARASHNAAEAILGQVHVPALIVMGDMDAAFPNPENEARRIAEHLSAKVLMVPGAGHYPQAEFPELVAPAVVEFVRRTVPPPA